jgi:probable F420-dependent oxidoreductase
MATYPTLLSGPVGLWTGTLEMLPPNRVREVVAELDAQGWGGLWFGEAYGREAFTNAAMLLGASSRMTVATGIANIYGRDAMAMAGAAKTVAAQFPGRFIAGLGVSHAPLVERMRGHEYAGPVATMRAYLSAMAQAPFLAAPPEIEPPIVLAALGPKMLELAAEQTAGVHPYLVTPAWTARTREIVGPDAHLIAPAGRGPGSPSPPPVRSRCRCPAPAGRRGSHPRPGAPAPRRPRPLRPRGRPSPP